MDSVLRLALVAAIVVAASLAPALAAESLSIPSPSLGRPRLTAVPVQSPPVMDGLVDLDPAWASAPVATGFVQTSPDDGHPSSERTEVRVVYTRDTLYVG